MLGTSLLIDVPWRVFWYGCNASGVKTSSQNEKDSISSFYSSSSFLVVASPPMTSFSRRSWWIKPVPHFFNLDPSINWHLFLPYRAKFFGTTYYRKNPKRRLDRGCLTVLHSQKSLTDKLKYVTSGGSKSIRSLLTSPLKEAFFQKHHSTKNGTIHRNTACFKTF